MEEPNQSDEEDTVEFEIELVSCASSVSLALEAPTKGDDSERGPKGEAADVDCDVGQENSELDADGARQDKTAHAEAVEAKTCSLEQQQQQQHQQQVTSRQDIEQQEEACSAPNPVDSGQVLEPVQNGADALSAVGVEQSGAHHSELAREPVELATGNGESQEGDEEEQETIPDKTERVEQEAQIVAAVEFVQEPVGQVDWSESLDQNQELEDLSAQELAARADGDTVAQTLVSPTDLTIETESNQLIDERPPLAPPLPPSQCAPENEKLQTEVVDEQHALPEPGDGAGSDVSPIGGSSLLIDDKLEAPALAPTFAPETQPIACQIVKEPTQCPAGWLQLVEACELRIELVEQAARLMSASEPELLLATQRVADVDAEVDADADADADSAGDSRGREAMEAPEAASEQAGQHSGFSFQEEPNRVDLIERDNEECALATTSDFAPADGVGSSGGGAELQASSEMATEPGQLQMQEPGEMVATVAAAAQETVDSAEGPAAAPYAPQVFVQDDASELLKQSELEPEDADAELCGAAGEAEEVEEVGEAEEACEAVEEAEEDLEREFDEEPEFERRDVVVKRNQNPRAEYELGAELGRGKFGTVYRCSELASGRQLAAKFITMRRREDREDVEREVAIMSVLQHKRLLQLYDAFDDGRQEMCLITELVEGGELFERIVDDDFDLTEKKAAIFMRQICEGVDYMHGQQIVHLDMKPENILCLSRTGYRIKLIDFGLARKLDPRSPIRVMFGTPDFAAPEVLGYETVTLATDMWSVGVICYVLLSGLSPFMGESDMDTMANVTRATFDFNDQAFEPISDLAKDFIRKLLLRNPAERLKPAECLQHAWLQRGGAQLEAAVRERRESLSTSMLLLQQQQQLGGRLPGLEQAAAGVAATTAAAATADLTPPISAGSLQHHRPSFGAESTTSSGLISLDKRRLKRYVVKRKWHKTVHAIMALNRMGANLNKLTSKLPSQ